MRRLPILALLALVGAAHATAAEVALPPPPPQEVLEPAPPRSDLGVTPPTPAEESPWSHGVSEKDRQAADALFQEGNKLLRESITLSAATKYREGLAHWDHPNLHFNLAVALMSQDQPVETYQHLVQSVKYGVRPLEQERYQHAKNYIALLEKQIVRVQIRCDVPGGQVELDGQPLFTAPNGWEGLVRAGRHTLVARREGYVTNQSVRMWEGGKPVAVSLQLNTLEELTVHKRRWSAWKPWTLLGAGVAVTAVGVGLHVTGRNKVDTANRRAQEECSKPNTCSSEPADIAQLRKQGTQMQSAAMVAYAVGGSALVAGGILTWLNRDESHIRSYDSGESEPPPAISRLDIAPVLTPGGAGVSVALRF